MLLQEKLPKLLRLIVAVMFTFLILMTAYRFFFFYNYRPLNRPFSGSAFLLGLRYDLRIVSVIGLSMLILAAFRPLNPFRRESARPFWLILAGIAFILFLIFYGADFYHFDYLKQRLNASVLNYLQDAGISFGMMWQTYPLIRILLAVIVLSVLFIWWIRYLFGKINVSASYNAKKRTRVITYTIAVLLLAISIFGKLGQYPLRWSDAFSIGDDFKASAALNPFQSFFSTLSFRNSSYDAAKVRASYPLMTELLGLQNPDSVKLNFERNYSPVDSFVNKPNIVVVICESFSAYKSSMYGNPLNTTPFFNELSKQGAFFDRCFTPAYGTARGVWATITGIPDVENPRTASRNPAAVDQRCIINDFKGYQPLYFIGGDASWANIRGLLTNNIHGLKLYQQDDYKAAKVDVWGISDKNLFLESNKILKEQRAPFFAVIQTADNHRPYTIPSEDLQEFKKVNVPEDSLKTYGFISNDELNAFRYTDFSYKKFMEAARKEKYFQNTIFVFVGDHGIRGDAGPLFPKAWTAQGLDCEHVPLLFYSPAFIQPKRESGVCSQVDILPSLAALAKIPYSNNTLGKNLFDSAARAKQNFAFIIDHDVRSIGVVSNEYYYLKNLKSGLKEMVSVKNNDPVPQNAKTDSVKKHMDRVTDAYYYTSQYLLLNNKKKN
ncbi:MAG: alkaline phosphatase family protein [Ferruginibacter sp.]|nr:alkaline phosphatase family protein [Ferruginibacter sp.]